MTLAEYRKERPQPAAAHEELTVVERGSQRHPGPLEYAQIGLVLAIVTAVEVAIYYLGISHALLVAMLLVLSALKFSLVVLWFMHLKFDNRLFAQLFAGGFLLALSVFVVALATVGGRLV